VERNEILWFDGDDEDIDDEVEDDEDFDDDDDEPADDDVVAGDDSESWDDDDEEDEDEDEDEEDDDEDDDVLRPGLGIIPKMVADSHVLERNRLELAQFVLFQPAILLVRTKRARQRDESRDLSRLEDGEEEGLESAFPGPIFFKELG
jgi:hypothetical protein